jgi:hypothetical protein
MFESMYIGVPRIWPEAESYYRGPMMSVLAELLHGVPSAPSARQLHLGAGFDTWFLQACHREPESRFLSASQQIDALVGVRGLPCASPGGDHPPAPSVDKASSPTVTDASSVASERPRPKKRLVRVAGAALALAAAILAYRAFSARESTRLVTPNDGSLGSPQIDARRDAPPGMPAERMPQPPAGAATPPATKADTDAAEATAPAGVAARVTPAPRRKPARAREPVSSAGSEAASTPDPYKDQK